MDKKDIDRYMSKMHFKKIVEHVMKNRNKTNIDGMNYYSVKSFIDDSIVVKLEISDEMVKELVNDYNIDVELKVCQALAIQLCDAHRNAVYSLDEISDDLDFINKC